ncbi:gas vesicle protein [Spirillospora sp. NPDC049652]
MAAAREDGSGGPAAGPASGTAAGPARRGRSARRGAARRQGAIRRRAGKRRVRRTAMKAVEAAREAVEQLVGLTGRDAEGVVGVERSGDDGWIVTVEIVETHRIPDSADILACYRVELDADGDLVNYHRAHRYMRGHVDGRHR